MPITNLNGAGSSYKQLDTVDLLGAMMTMQASFAGGIAIVSKKRFGLNPKLREQTKRDMDFMLAPLRAFFLREAVAYVQQNVRHGLEWMCKFALLFTTWLQNDSNAGAVGSTEQRASTFPENEVRTLLQFVLHSDKNNAPPLTGFYSLAITMRIQYPQVSRIMTTRKQLLRQHKTPFVP